jgi:hypothetical protein
MPPAAPSTATLALAAAVAEQERAIILAGSGVLSHSSFASTVRVHLTIRFWMGSQLNCLLARGTSLLYVSVHREPSSGGSIVSQYVNRSFFTYWYLNPNDTFTLFHDVYFLLAPSFPPSLFLSIFLCFLISSRRSKSTWYQVPTKCRRFLHFAGSEGRQYCANWPTFQRFPWPHQYV